MYICDCIASKLLIYNLVVLQWYNLQHATSRFFFHRTPSIIHISFISFGVSFNKIYRNTEKSWKIFCNIRKVAKVWRSLENVLKMLRSRRKFCDVTALIGQITRYLFFEVLENILDS